eukprot:m.116268 g.116268  ORF g.116268 m.116268 type:complete len:119 (+) comp51936_c1_seq3:86-442(+)
MAGYRAHLRSSIFEHALLPFINASALSVPTLHKLALFAKSSRHSVFPLLCFQDWQKWAGDVLALSPDVAWLYFESYESVSGKPLSTTAPSTGTFPNSAHTCFTLTVFLIQVLAARNQA